MPNAAFLVIGDGKVRPFWEGVSLSSQEQSSAHAFWTKPEGWPKLSLAQVEAQLCAPGERFEMETCTIRGVPTRTWKHAPRSLRHLADHARGHGDRLMTIYEDERVTYEAWYRAVAHMARALQSRAIGKGDRVALAMRNLPEWSAAFFAATSIGAISTATMSSTSSPAMSFTRATKASRWRAEGAVDPPNRVVPGIRRIR